jgi:hypothetical protein
MRESHWTAVLLSATVVTMLVVAANASAAAPPDPTYEPAIRRALALLPKQPSTIAIVDANDAKPDTRRTLVTLDAFIVRGSKVVYLVKQSVVLQMAAKGNPIMDYMLASIIWHEMAHADGAGEREAQRREEQLWTQFVRDQRMDQVVALRYLAALQKRQEDVLEDGRSMPR